MSQGTDASVEMQPPTLPIPTGIAWVVMEHIIGGAPLERIAQMAGYGAILLGEEKDEATIIERFRKFLRRQVKRGQAPLPGKAKKLLAAIRAAANHQLQKAFPGGRGEQLFAQFSEAEGPFTVLALMIQPTETTPDWLRLMELSGSLDRMGTAFGGAIEVGDFPMARDALLDAEGIDATYWAAPELGLPEAEASRLAVQGANSWLQLKRAAAPVIFNSSLSWLSLLDIATLSVGKYVGADFSLFLPLITRPSSERLSPDVFEADRERLPVANLIRMVESIGEDIRAEQRHRLKPSERNLPVSGKAGLRERAKVLKRHDFISMADFSGLLRDWLPPDDGRGNAERWFDIYALVPAANLFSLLTMRDGQTPLKGSRRKAPEQIACFPEVEAGYRRWWAQHRNKLAGGNGTCPRPSWFTTLLAEAGHTDNHR